MIESLIKKTLESSALILSVVNCFATFYQFARNKPKLIVSPVHPEIYQCWLRLKDVQKEGQVIRRYAFLSYFEVANAGIRNVSIQSWRLHIKNNLCLWRRWHKKKELNPYNLPETQLLIGEHIKCIKPFGQKTQNFQDSSTMVQSGDSISGMACWIYSVWGGEGWSPQTNKKHEITANLIIGSVLGNQAKCKLVFYESSLDRLNKMIPNIGKYFENSEDFLI